MPAPAVTPLRVGFLGTPDFALPTLKALAAAGHEIAAVYSQPPRPAGRGQKERPSPVQGYAESRGWPLRTPKTLKDPEAQAAFAALRLDVAVVVAYGLILPQAILAAPRLGCVNVHASLLPRWRGAAPIQRAILAGDRETGVTLMQMEAGLDTGPMLLRKAVPIDRLTAQDLHDRLAALGAATINEALEGLATGRLTATPQPDEGVTYAGKIDKAEGRLDWRAESAEALERRVRAFTPWPGAYFEVAGEKGPERVKVLAAEPRLGKAAPGTLLDDEATVACSEGALRLLTVQRAGKAPMAIDAFLRGFPLPAGTVLP